MPRLVTWREFAPAARACVRAGWWSSSPAIIGWVVRHFEDLFSHNRVHPMDMRLRSDAVWFRPMRCRPESVWDCVFKGYPITTIGRSGVPDFGHCSQNNVCESSLKNSSAR